MKHLAKQSLSLLFLLSWSLASFGLEMGLDTPVTPLFDQAEFYEDTEGNVTLDQAIALHRRGVFEPLSADQVSQGITPSAFWIRLRIENIEHRPVPWVLFHSYGFTQLTDTYIIDAVQENRDELDWVVEYQLTEETPYTQRPLIYRAIAIPGRLAAHQSQVIYIRQAVNYSNTQHLAWNIGPRLAFDAYVAQDRSIHFFFYGVMAAFIIVSLMTAIRSQSWLLMLYSAYLFFASISWAEISGHLGEVVFPDNPAASTFVSNIGMFITAGLIFEMGRRFLRLNKNMPIMDKAFQFATGLCVVGTVAAYAGFGALSTLVMYSLVVFLAAYPVVGLLVLRKGFGYVKWFVVGLSLHAITLVFLGLAGAGLLLHAEYYYAIAQSVLVVEAAVFGLAMAERIVDTRRQIREEERAWREAQRHADTDALTNLPNRRKFEQRLGNLLKTVEGTRNTHLIILDIDSFSEINSRWGHQAGDNVLCELAHLLQESIRSHDFVARYKGSRFAMLLTETNVDSALLVIDRIRSQFEAKPTRWEEDTEIHHTFSAGIASTKMDSTSALLIDEANRALAQAKDGGKNRISGLQAA